MRKSQEIILELPLVSYTLRETQARMLRFVSELQENIGDNLNRTFLPLVACYLFHSAVFAPIMLAFLFEFFADQVLGLGRGALRGRVAPEPSRTGPPAAVLELHVYLFKFPSASSMSRSPWLSRPRLGRGGLAGRGSGQRVPSTSPCRFWLPLLGRR